MLYARFRTFLNSLVRSGWQPAKWKALKLGTLSSLRTFWLNCAMFWEPADFLLASLCIHFWLLSTGLSKSVAFYVRHAPVALYVKMELPKVQREIC